MSDLTLNQAKQIIKAIFRETKPTWEKWMTPYRELDYTFLKRGYEQLGFDCDNFVNNFLSKYGIGEIEKIGKIIKNLGYIEDNYKYQRDFSGAIDAPFYSKLKQGKAGEEGILFYRAVRDFLNSETRKGASFWRLLWCMLVSCQFLNKNYRGSFRLFVINKLSEFYSKTFSDTTFKNLSILEWKKFLSTKPWQFLLGIGPNTFDYIFRDTPELTFAKGTFKLDTSNIKFLNITGIWDLRDKSLSGKRKVYKELLNRICEDIPISEVGKAIYAFSAKGGRNLCNPPKACSTCIVESICLKNFKSK